MTFEEFANTISRTEYFDYSHIMEIPESSLSYAKLLNNEQWNYICKEKYAIALCCCIEDKVHIIFSGNCYKVTDVLESTKVEQSCIIENLNNIKKVYITSPRNINGEIYFSDEPHELGRIKLVSEFLYQKTPVYSEQRQKSKDIDLKDNFERVFDLRRNTCAQVSVDDKPFNVFEHEFKFLVLQNNAYFFTNDLIQLVDASKVLSININKFEIDYATFISNEFFYYTALEFDANFKNYTKCGLISTSKGEIVKSNRYSSISHFIESKYFIVNLKDKNEKYKVNDGLIDINGNELLPALYYEIIIIPDNDNKLTIWLKKEEKNNEWLIYDQDSNKIRKATENDFLEN
jgi:hypothetical protein